MVRERLRRLDARGFSLAELIVTCAVIGILLTIAVPNFVSFWQSRTLQSGAGELVTALNLARQLAIARNTNVCVQRSGNDVQLRSPNCAGAAVIVAGGPMDSNGVVRLSNSLRVSAGPTSVVFTALGSATITPANTTFTVSSPDAGVAATRTVAVTTAGRASIQ
jgi:prepilin-type N-terminal cleavage/methylation domain-containing protein